MTDMSTDHHDSSIHDVMNEMLENMEQSCSGFTDTRRADGTDLMLKQKIGQNASLDQVSSLGGDNEKVAGDFYDVPSDSEQTSAHIQNYDFYHGVDSHPQDCQSVKLENTDEDCHSDRDEISPDTCNVWNLTLNNDDGCHASVNKLSDQVVPVQKNLAEPLQIYDDENEDVQLEKRPTSSENTQCSVEENVLSKENVVVLDMRVSQNKTVEERSKLTVSHPAIIEKEQLLAMSHGHVHVDDDSDLPLSCPMFGRRNESSLLSREELALLSFVDDMSLNTKDEDTAYTNNKTAYGDFHGRRRETQNNRWSKHDFADHFKRDSKPGVLPPRLSGEEANGNRHEQAEISGDTTVGTNHDLEKQGETNRVDRVEMIEKEEDTFVRMKDSLISNDTDFSEVADLHAEQDVSNEAVSSPEEQKLEELAPTSLTESNIARTPNPGEDLKENKCLVRVTDSYSYKLNSQTHANVIVNEVPSIASCTELKTGSFSPHLALSSSLPEGCTTSMVFKHRRFHGDPDTFTRPDDQQRSTLSQNISKDDVAPDNEDLDDDNGVVPDCDVDVGDDVDTREVTAEESFYDDLEEKNPKGKCMPAPSFKWKYRPSCDMDEDSLVPSTTEEPALGVIQPLPVQGVCYRRMRLGLSRRQKVKRLHNTTS